MSSEKRSRREPERCAPEMHPRRARVVLRADVVYDGAATMLAAVGDPDRLRLLLLLRSRPMTTAELAAVVGAHKSLVTQQLRVLRLVRLARRVRRGNDVRYEIHDQRAESFLTAFVHRMAGLRP